MTEGKGRGANKINKDHERCSREVPHGYSKVDMDWDSSAPPESICFLCGALGCYTLKTRHGDRYLCEDCWKFNDNDSIRQAVLSKLRDEWKDRVV